MGADHCRTADDLLRVRRANWPEAVSPINHLAIRIFRLGSRLRDDTVRQVSRYQLTFTEFEVLVALRSAPPPHELMPTALYDAVLISSGGLTKVLNALESRHLVARGEGETDRRSKPVQLTAKGCALAERAMADVMRGDRERMAGRLSDAEIERLNRLLDRLIAGLEPGVGPA